MQGMTSAGMFAALTVLNRGSAAGRACVMISIAWVEGGGRC